MSDIHRVLLSHPAAPEVSPGERSLEGHLIEVCMTTAAICRVAADALLESSVTDEVRDRVRAQQGCADVCTATAAVVSRPGAALSADGRELVVPLLDACRTACDVTRRLCAPCADAHDYYRLTADACGRCVQACRELLHRLEEPR